MNPAYITRALAEAGARRAVRFAMPVLGPCLEAVLGDLDAPTPRLTTIGETVPETRFPCSTFGDKGDGVVVESHPFPERGVWVSTHAAGTVADSLLDRPSAHRLGRLLLGV